MQKTQCIGAYQFVTLPSSLVAIFPLTIFVSTAIWGLFCQTIGFALVGPLYYAAYIWASADENYWWPLSRQVPTPYAKTILPALLLGYLLPTLLMLLPYSAPSVLQARIVSGNQRQYTLISCYTLSHRYIRN